MSTRRSTDFIVKRTALIDGDILVWRTASAVASQQMDALEMHERIMFDVEEWTRRAFCTHAIVCLSGPRESNFRRKVYELYKAHRPDERPEHHAACLQIVSDNCKTFQRKALEADDCLGLLATLGTVQQPVMVSIDKDLRTVPGWHFNPDKEDFPVRVRWDAADRMWMTQWMCGDSSDGYKGMEKIGPKKAEGILERAEQDEMDPVVAVLKAYRDHAKGYDLDYTLAMARVSRILRAEDWDTKKKAPKLWTPSDTQLEAAGW